MNSHSRVSEEAVEHLAARLANTGQVLDAWAGAMGSTNEILERRLRRAVRELHGVVASLTVDEDEFSALEQGGADAHVEISPPGDPTVLSSLGDVLGMRGRSEMISCIEFVAFLSSLGKDGVLQVQTDKQQFLIELRGGCVVYATVEPDAPGTRLSTTLIDKGAITTSALDDGIANARKDEFLGETLLRQGLISREALLTALTEQALWVFRAVHEVGTGFDFQFEENTQIVLEPDIRLGISHLLLESARLQDEAAKNSWAPNNTPEKDDVLRYRTRLDEALEDEELTLPVLPDATGQLLALCWADDFDVDELLECVHRDQALCAHLLRIANSAACAPVTPISSIQRAITRLGLDKLREVAMALTLKQKIFRLPGWEDVIKSLWHTAAVTSGFATSISKTCGTGGIRGTMTGLLLDVGKPIVLNALYEIQREEESELTPEVADILMEEYHCRIGTLLADQWSLPDWMTGVMCHHHDYDAAEEHRGEAMIGNLAGEFAIWAQAPKENDLARLIALPVCAELKLNKDDVVAILKQSKQILRMARAYS